MKVHGITCNISMVEVNVVSNFKVSGDNVIGEIVFCNSVSPGSIMKSCAWRQAPIYIFRMNKFEAHTWQSFFFIATRRQGDLQLCVTPTPTLNLLFQKSAFLHTQWAGEEDIHVHVYQLCGGYDCMQVVLCSIHMWPLLITWINFNPSMDK